jgi:hypothetical protein
MQKECPGCNLKQFEHGWYAGRASTDAHRMGCVSISSVRTAARMTIPAHRFQAATMILCCKTTEVEYAIDTQAV